MSKSDRRTIGVTLLAIFISWALGGQYGMYIAFVCLVVGIVIMVHAHLQPERTPAEEPFTTLGNIKPIEEPEAERRNLRSVLPVNRPFVIPIRYGHYQETKGHGLLVANDEYAANTVSIPDVAIAQTASILSFKGTLPRLAHREENFFEAVIRHPDRPERDGDQLYKTMVLARVDELKVGIVYQGTNFQAYRSNFTIRREPGEAGLKVKMVSQEPIDALPS